MKQTTIEGEVWVCEFCPTAGRDLHLLIAPATGSVGTKIQLRFQGDATKVTLDGVASDRAGLIAWLAEFGPLPPGVRPFARVVTDDPDLYVPRVTADFTTRKDPS